ncbi:hypothetical protein [Klebsiella pneumoniae ISC21]|nr:hypothetical protein [Klebsiella pneumoniae ISC21]
MEASRLGSSGGSPTTLTFFSQQVIEQLRIVNRNVSRVTVTIFLGNVDLTSVDTRFANLVLIDLLQEGRIIHLAAIRLAGPKALEY